MTSTFSHLSMSWCKFSIIIKATSNPILAVSFYISLPLVSVILLPQDDAHLKLTCAVFCYIFLNLLARRARQESRIFFLVNVNIDLKDFGNPALCYILHSRIDAGNGLSHPREAIYNTLTFVPFFKTHTLIQ